MAKKRLASGYTFTAAAKTISHADFSDITLAGIQVIVNVTDQIIIYNFADTTKGGTLATDTLTLEYDTTTMSDTDELMILVEDGVASQAITAASLPLPTGAATLAEQQTQTTSLSVLDDWDETDRAKVNIIAGQAGVAAGAGAVGVTVPRVTLASDDPAVVALQLLDNAVSGAGFNITQVNGEAVDVGAGTEAAAIRVTLPTNGTGILAGVTTVTSLTQMNGQAIAMGTGVRSAGTQRVTIATDDLVPISAASLPLPTGAATSANQSTMITSLQLLDDAAVVLGTATYTEATSVGFSIGAVRRDADTTLVGTTNEWGPLQMDARGFVKTEVFSGETLPVSAASLPLPTGASTLAEQQTQTTALQLIDDTVYTDDTSTHATGTSKGIGFMAAANPTDSAVDANDIAMLAMTLSRNLKVDFAGSAANATAGLFSVKFDQTTVGTTNGVSLAQLGATTVATGNGASSAGVLRVAQVNDGTGVLAGVTTVTTVTTVSTLTGTTTLTPGTGATNLGKAIDSIGGATDTGVAELAIRDDALTTLTPVDGDYVANRVNARGAKWVAIEDGAGGQITSFGGGTEVAEDTGHSSGVLGGVPMAVRRDTPTSLAGADNDYIPTTTDANGAVWVSMATKLDATNDTVGIGPQTTGGLTTYHLVSAGSTNASSVKASAGQLYGWYIYNSNAAARKVAFHNTAGTPSAGASIFFSLVIPPSSGANVFSAIGIPFSTGIGITTVTGLADSDSAAVAANDLIINLFYK